MNKITLSLLTIIAFTGMQIEAVTFVNSCPFPVYFNGYIAPTNTKSAGLQISQTLLPQQSITLPLSIPDKTIGVGAHGEALGTISTAYGSFAVSEAALDNAGFNFYNNRTVQSAFRNTPSSKALFEIDEYDNNAGTSNMRYQGSYNTNATIYIKQSTFASATSISVSTNP